MVLTVWKTCLEIALGNEQSISESRDPEILASDDLEFNAPVKGIAKDQARHEDVPAGTIATARAERQPHIAVAAAGSTRLPAVVTWGDLPAWRDRDLRGARPLPLPVMRRSMLWHRCSSLPHDRRCS
ncbi:MAG TPA: hypothetical protein PLL30_15305 [Candidatus Krumholzibacteria bacterium]|nr:hypothetical protein [Candidatus Krumholzibacteria bacterium]HPD73138.1 hypothetical protein [Candidatus Krumholzibacteria bacterium]HRY41984.1 hypothetical protein [Candidatus Krumholzibacteria bacterium]